MFHHRPGGNTLWVSFRQGHILNNCCRWYKSCTIQDIPDHNKSMAFGYIMLLIRSCRISTNTSSADLFPESCCPECHHFSTGREPPQGTRLVWTRLIETIPGHMGSSIFGYLLGGPSHRQSCWQRSWALTLFLPATSFEVWAFSLQAVHEE